MNYMKFAVTFIVSIIAYTTIYGQTKLHKLKAQFYHYNKNEELRVDWSQIFQKSYLDSLYNESVWIYSRTSGVVNIHNFSSYVAIFNISNHEPVELKPNHWVAVKKKHLDDSSAITYYLTESLANRNVQLFKMEIEENNKKKSKIELDISGNENLPSMTDTLKKRFLAREKEDFGTVYTQDEDRYGQKIGPIRVTVKDKRIDNAFSDAIAVALAEGLKANHQNTVREQKRYIRYLTERNEWLSAEVIPSVTTFLELSKTSGGYKVKNIRKFCNSNPSLIPGRRNSTLLGHQLF